MGRLKSISGRVLISYMSVVLITFIMTTLAFYPILVGVLETRAQIGLEKQAWEIAFIAGSRQSEALNQAVSLPASILLLGRSVESNYMLVGPDSRINFSSQPQEFPVGQRLAELPHRLRSEQLMDPTRANIYHSEDYLAVEVPIGTNPEINGTVITFVALQTLRNMYLQTLYLILGNLFIALVSALVIAYLLIGYIARPLKSLEAYAEAMGNRQFDIKLDTRSSDELSNLAEAFNQMAERLKKYDESMRQFFQHASHEMKTPLMSIHGYAEGLRDGIFEGPALKEAVDVIHKESLRLRDLVDNMIDITILDQPHRNYFLPHYLSYIVENALESVGGYALDRRIAVTADIADDVIVVGDWDRLMSLLVNLLSNAIRHARCSVSIRSQTIDRVRQVQITVEDDGSGFSAEDLSHAFEYFYTRAEGSGLGLAIARKIVEEHQGTIELTNISGQGASVIVVLPGVPDDAAGLI